MKRKASNRQPANDGILAIRQGKDAPLSRTQVEFNRLMKNLESAKASHAREQARLDNALTISIRELMPLIEELNRANLDLVIKGRTAWQTFKLGAKRHRWLGDLLSGKAEELLADSVGLSEEEIARLQAFVEELGPSIQKQQMEEEDSEEFDFLRSLVEQAAREAGVEVDLSDLDPTGDPVEFERMMYERLGPAASILEEMASGQAAPKRPRKPTKAQAAKERARLAQEEAKNRDLKSLFKQLAKAFHPDLEPDLTLKQHKEVWMKRLNTAYATNDLREMLQLEMEWLGEEATNLATAGDEKLKVYCMVLKEQIDDIKRQTHFLPDQPQYGPLQRFRNPFYGTIASPVTIKRELQDQLRHHREMVKVLDANNASSRRMVNEWADEHAFRSSCPF